ncbi:MULTISPECIES: LysM peptidoglycan-binding domain-containing protein [unclassified Bradyrhizobium]|uniref:LysM peptidoglycan-binding domain-containing protein n=1 Tax=unclassified Bradyrhizobium TaxID=2631580 RepID=UPI0028EC3911|nr:MULTISPECIES: LysM peptidoglycan-binding domain-containing protein [unclassified Bradyrhizobium]
MIVIREQFVALNGSGQSMNVVSRTSNIRVILLLVAIVVSGSLAPLYFSDLFTRHDQPAPVAPSASNDSDAAKPPTSQQAAPTTLAGVQKQASDLAATLGPSPSPSAPDDGTPSFDVVSVEPTGEAVVAGRAAPGATVELLRNGEVHDRAVVDKSGQFAMVPRPLPPGTYDLTLRARQPDGKEIASKQSVAVVIDPTSERQKSAGERPMVALMTPDKPTVVLSRPTGPAESVAVETADVDASGKLQVSGRAHPGADVRLYLNDSFIASATAGADGRVAITIKEGVAPGRYRVRLDEVESGSGKVRSRAEVPVTVPEMTAALSPREPAAAAPEKGAARQTASADASGTVPPDEGNPSSVVVSKIATVTVSRGDSLWHISRKALGIGAHYAVIYKANREQIRNPDLIYPGQVFVLPKRP